MKVIVTGDSHTAALQKGFLALRSEARWPDEVALTVRPLGGGHLTRDPFFIDRGDHAQITTPEYRRQFERLPVSEADGEETTYGISAPLHSVRIWRHADWRTFAPSGTAGGGVPVSLSLTRRVMLDDQRHVLDLIAILIRNRKRVFVIEAPHPFRHHPALRTTSPELVLRLNRLYRDTMRHALKTLAVPIVAVPELCIEDGFMRDQYAQPGDPHHGNERYGRLMMEEVLAWLLGSARNPSAGDEIPGQDMNEGRVA